MNLFDIHTTDTAPEAAVDLLDGVKKTLGFKPNLYGVFAESPVTLSNYTNHLAHTPLHAAFEARAWSSDGGRALEAI